MTFRKNSLALLLLTLAVPCLYASKQPKYEQVHPLTPDQAALVDKAIEREKVLIKSIQERTPLVETYIQDIKPDIKLYQIPVNDEYMLSRIDFAKDFFDKSFQPRSARPTKSADGKRKFFRGSLSSLLNLSKMLKLDTNFTYNPLGFTEMMFLDPTSFDTQHYEFGFVRREFLGSVRTWVYDVHPKVNGMGRFYGRIWVEDQDGNIVRFNGSFTKAKNENDSRLYFHFDSWRMNVQPGIWLPVAVYVEETERMEGEATVGLKAQTHFWGYSLRLPTRESESVSMQIDDAVDKSEDSADVSPLAATRAWVNQAENNVIDRLVEAGLVAPLNQGGYENSVLDQIVINLSVPNNLAFTDPVKCRVLLLNTVEATTVGNTILISKGLIDTLPSEEAIASVVAMELAHIALGHHIDTRYAFNDRLLFPDESSFQRINMFHSIPDNLDAAKKAQEYLQVSMYKDKLPSAGLYWSQLADRGKTLKALNSPRLGDSLLQEDGTPWMADLARNAPKLDWDDLAQIPALPMGSWLKTDPWDDKVYMLNAKRYAPMNVRDKMPLEVTPILYRLQRYNAGKPALQTTPAAPQPASAAPVAAAPASNGVASEEPLPLPDTTAAERTGISNPQ